MPAYFLGLVYVFASNINQNHASLIYGLKFHKDSASFFKIGSTLVYPPSTIIFCPLMKLAPLDSRNETTVAISSCFAFLPNGLLSMASFITGESIPDPTHPGEIETTLIPFLPNTFPRLFVKFINPALLAE